MATLDPVVERVRAHSGADFAFVLTRKGRLVTHAAPREMPEIGRARLVRAARPLVGTEEVIEVTLPRQELVPYGGAAPVDVYIAVAAEQAILCVVMSTWSDKIRVVPAVLEGIRALEPILHYRRPRKSTVPPPKEHAAGLVSLAGSVAIPSPALQRAPVIHASSVHPGQRGSLPDILVSEAALGRESLAAIQLEASHRGSVPEIAVAEAPIGRETLAAIDAESLRKGSAPEIAIGVAPLGRETLAAINLEARPPATSMPDHIRVELESAPEDLANLRPAPDPTRMTQPWIEAPEDAKRATDGARVGRKLTPPRLTLKLEEADPDVIEARRRIAELEAKTVRRPPRKR